MLQLVWSFVHKMKFFGSTVFLRIAPDLYLRVVYHLFSKDSSQFISQVSVSFIVSGDYVILVVNLWVGLRSGQGVNPAKPQELRHRMR